MLRPLREHRKGVIGLMDVGGSPIVVKGRLYLPGPRGRATKVGTLGNDCIKLVGCHVAIYRVKRVLTRPKSWLSIMTRAEGGEWQE